KKRLRRESKNYCGTRERTDHSRSRPPAVQKKRLCDSRLFVQRGRRYGELLRAGAKREQRSVERSRGVCPARRGDDARVSFRKRNARKAPRAHAARRISDRS